MNVVSLFSTSAVAMVDVSPVSTDGEDITGTTGVTSDAKRGQTSKLPGIRRGTESDHDV